MLTPMMRGLAIVLVAAVLIVAALAFDFVRRAQIHQGTADLPRTAIVFTGQFDRIELGLDLLAAGRIDRLFISGVNGPAGLDPARFASQFELTPRQTRWLSDGQIILAPDARTTLENAVETACWLDRQPPVPAVTLITSRRHMARASLVLQRVIAPIAVVRVAPQPSGLVIGSRLSEFEAFAASWVITLMPRRWWPIRSPATCRRAPAPPPT